MAESRINIFVFGIVFGVRIDRDEDAPDARDKRQRAAAGTPGIMGRRIARNGRHRGLKELCSSGLFIGKFNLCGRLQVHCAKEIIGNY